MQPLFLRGYVEAQPSVEVEDESESGHSASKIFAQDRGTHLWSTPSIPDSLSSLVLSSPIWITVKGDGMLRDGLSFVRLDLRRRNARSGTSSMVSAFTLAGEARDVSVGNSPCVRMFISVLTDMVSWDAEPVDPGAGTPVLEYDKGFVL